MLYNNRIVSNNKYQYRCCGGGRRGSTNDNCMYHHFGVTTTTTATITITTIQIIEMIFQRVVVRRQLWWWWWWWWWSSFLVTSLIVVVATAARTTTNEEQPDELECHLFMGPSTIPHAGLGIFSGRDYTLHHSQSQDDDDDNQSNHDVYIGLGDICIPIVDMYTHINVYHDSSNVVVVDDDGTRKPRFKNPREHFNRHWVFNPMRDYFWNGYSAMGMIHGESTSMDIEAYCPGLDCAINCHLGLVNVDSSVPSYNDYHSVRSDKTERYVHPGTGAYSPYHILAPSKTDTTEMKKKVNILRNIPVGGELFKHYGESWFTTRPEIFGNIPLTDDYVFGEELLQKFMSLQIVVTDNNNTNQSDTTDTNTGRVAVVDDFYNNVLIQTIQRIYDTRTLNALPKLYSEIQNVIHMNDNDGIITRILQRKHQRSISDLQTSAACLDHIRPGTSTISHAGDGAFATRNLPNNTIITISPLHHIPNYHNFMNMYHIQQSRRKPSKSPHGGNVASDDDDDTDEDDNNMPYYRILDDIQNQQLLLNYCYGHVNSTVLLCPYGSGINYINHHSTKFNVQLRWIPSSSSQLLTTFSHNITAVERGTIDDLFRSEKSQLAIQYVAIRDIQEGEELLIHYGTEWEKAWNSHVQQFYTTAAKTANDPSSLSSYKSASFWNTVRSHNPLPTIHEQIQETSMNTNLLRLPTNLQTKCHRALLLQAIGSRSSRYVWSDDNHGIPCRIIDRFLDGDEYDTIISTALNDKNNSNASAKESLYTVQLEWKEDENNVVQDDTTSSSIIWIQRTDVPRSAIQLFDIPYTNDIHQRQTFRHPIHLSNDVFPKQWRNLE